MVKALSIAAAAAAAILVVWAVVALRSGIPRPAAPPLVGWMQNFTPAADGGPAPERAFFGRDGGAYTLAGFRGRVVLVNFWATWCAPCLREMPSLDRLQAALGGPGFTVLAMSLDRKGWPVIDPFVKRVGLETLPVYLDREGALAGALNVQGLPTSVLFGRDGREKGRLIGIAKWDSREAVALMRHYMGRDRR